MMAITVEYLIEVIVGKGLYEQYKRRSKGIVPDASSKIKHRTNQNHSKLPQHDPHHPTFSHKEITHEKGQPDPAIVTSTFLLINRQKQHIPTKNKSRLQIHAAIKCKYKFVQYHFPQNNSTLDNGDDDASNLMQSYDYSPLDTGPAIGFQAYKSRRRVYAPRRKWTDLESLPPLNAEVSSEMAKTQRIQEQAQILAKAREKMEKAAEEQRRANRDPQQRVPPYVPPINIFCSAEELEDAQLSDGPSTPPPRTRSKQDRKRSDQQVEQARANIRWAPPPVQ